MAGVRNSVVTTACSVMVLRVRLSPGDGEAGVRRLLCPRHCPEADYTHPCW